MPNKRLPRAAKTLIAEVEAKHKNAKHEAVGEPDGLNVQRQVEFGPKATGDFLAKALEVLVEVDPRIESFEQDKKSGKVTVTFAGSRLADDASPFHLENAAGSAGEEEAP